MWIKAYSYERVRFVSYALLKGYENSIMDPIIVLCLVIIKRPYVDPKNKFLCFR